MMTPEDWIQMFGPALTSAGGAVLAVKVMYGRIREDIAELYAKVDELDTRFTKQAVLNAQEHGEVKREIGILAERIDNMRSPWSQPAKSNLKRE